MKCEKKKNRHQELWDSMKQCNICKIGILEEERENGAKQIFEKIMTENFLNLVTNTKLKIKEVQRTPSRIHVTHTHTPLALPYSNCRKLKTKKNF